MMAYTNKNVLVSYSVTLQSNRHKLTCLVEGGLVGGRVGLADVGGIELGLAVGCTNE